MRVNDADVEIEGEEGEMQNQDLITFDDVEGVFFLLSLKLKFLQNRYIKYERLGNSISLLDI